MYLIRYCLHVRYVIAWKGVHWNNGRSYLFGNALRGSGRELRGDEDNSNVLGPCLIDKMPDVFRARGFASRLHCLLFESVGGCEVPEGWVVHEECLTLQGRENLRDPPVERIEFALELGKIPPVNLSVVGIDPHEGTADSFALHLRQSRGQPDVRIKFLFHVLLPPAMVLVFVTNLKQVYPFSSIYNLQVFADCRNLPQHRPLEGHSRTEVDARACKAGDLLGCRFERVRILPRWYQNFHVRVLAGDSLDEERVRSNTDEDLDSLRLVGGSGVR